MVNKDEMYFVRIYFSCHSKLFKSKFGIIVGMVSRTDSGTKNEIISSYVYIRVHFIVYYCEWSITCIIENCILCEMAAYPLIKIIDISRHNSADFFLST